MAKMLIASVELGCSKEILTPEHLRDAVRPELLPLSIQRVFEYLLLSGSKASSTTHAERLLPAQGEAGTGQVEEGQVPPVGGWLWSACARTCKGIRPIGWRGGCACAIC